MTPYSALAAGRLSRRPDESSKRLEEDNYAKFKYDKTAETDGVIIDRVAGAGREARLYHDGDRPRVAADEGLRRPSAAQRIFRTSRGL